MLRAFMAFPIGFAAEGLGAVRECTAVGAFMPFLMFSVDGLISGTAPKQS